jgi:hypothetical protein
MDGSIRSALSLGDFDHMGCGIIRMTQVQVATKILLRCDHLNTFCHYLWGKMP